MDTLVLRPLLYTGSFMISSKITTFSYLMSLTHQSHNCGWLFEPLTLLYFCLLLHKYTQTHRLYYLPCLSFKYFEYFFLLRWTCFSLNPVSCGQGAPLILTCPLALWVPASFGPSSHLSPFSSIPWTPPQGLPGLLFCLEASQPALITRRLHLWSSYTALKGIFALEIICYFFGLSVS